MEEVEFMTTVGTKWVAWAVVVMRRGEKSPLVCHRDEDGDDADVVTVVVAVIAVVIAVVVVAVVVVAARI